MFGSTVVVFQWFLLVEKGISLRSHSLGIAILDACRAIDNRFRPKAVKSVIWWNPPPDVESKLL